jgi:hypothetical protein
MRDFRAPSQWIALTLCISLGAGAAQAGIVRDVLSSVGLASKPATPPPVSASGVAAFPRSGFACCNLHNDGDSINDGNYAKYPLIPAGTAVDVVKYDGNKALIRINNKNMKLKHDYGRDQESLDVWVNKIVINDDPRPKIAGYPPQVQAAIAAGRVIVGMTREQVIVAIGYPLTSENASLNEAQWRMWRSPHGEYDIQFASNGRVSAITGEDDVLTQMVYQPAR